MLWIETEAMIEPHPHQMVKGAYRMRQMSDLKSPRIHWLMNFVLGHPLAGYPFLSQPH